MHEAHIRPAVVQDAAAIARIYNHYIAESTATFDTTPKSEQDRRVWLENRSAAHPVVVVEEDGHVVGWGALSAYRDRPAWAATVEAAVYLAPDAVSRGLGGLVLSRLVTDACATGVHVVVAQVVSENGASLGLFERAGFERVGTLTQVGRKFGRWLDVVLFQKALGTEGATEC